MVPKEVGDNGCITTRYTTGPFRPAKVFQVFVFAMKLGKSVVFVGCIGKTVSIGEEPAVQPVAISFFAEIFDVRIDGHSSAR
jgi:hypothetical protein